jgi:predicted O-linked N-acetylglucosamine transferase (SPINDLY family)
VVLPRLDSERFIAAMGACDVMLDSIGWSGCNSTLESLVHDLPIVTLRGEFMRGRHTSAILEMMGLDEMIANTVDDYVAIAVRLGRNPADRAAASARIAAGKHRVYEDRTCVAALETFLDRAARSSASA